MLSNKWSLELLILPPPKVVAVPDLFLTAVKLTHDTTGAQHLHAARDDANNLFRLVEMCFITSTYLYSCSTAFFLQSHSIDFKMFVYTAASFFSSVVNKSDASSTCSRIFSVQFRTTPMDSTGVPHILEHTVLCGSQKYPCRDPFFKMLNRSLSTFMNAFTGTEKIIWT